MDANILLFDDFETLDAFGPVEIIGRLPDYQLRFISVKGGTVNSRQSVPVITEKLNASDFSGLLLIPGGQGTRALTGDDKFVNILRNLAQKSVYCLTVCTGSALLAKTGLLDGLQATSNKRALDWVKSVNPSVKWQNSARWTADGKFYTSSGVSAGIDMALGFTADRFGRGKASDIAAEIEYIWNDDKTADQFAAVR